MQKVILKTCRKLFLFIIPLVLGVLCMFVFTACSDDVTEADFRAKGYTVAVTYDYQGGVSNDMGSTRILIKPNSKLPKPSSDGGVRIPSKSGYSFKGFYLPEKDEDGNVKYDGQNNVIVSDTEWNFDVDRVVDSDVTLYAKWWNNYKVVLHYGSDYSKTKEISLQREVNGNPMKLSSSPLKVDNYTFLSYNLVKDSDNADTELKDFPYVWKQDAFASSDSIDVWGKSLDGIYILVKSKDDLHITYVGETTNYYLLNDIDMGGASYDDQESQTRIPKTYGGKFVGNGHTIGNFKMTMRAVDRSYDNFGLFRSLSSSAEITDVTFKDVTLSYYLSNANISNYYLGMLAGQSSAGATVRNVKFTASAQKSNVFEYKIGVGVDQDKLNVAEDMLIAQKPADADLQNCSVDSVTRVYSTAIITADKEFALYIKYTEQDGEITLPNDAIYALALKNNDGDYEEKNIKSCEYVSKNRYKLTRIIYNYDVVFTVENGEISATMTLIP